MDNIQVKSIQKSIQEHEKDLLDYIQLGEFAAPGISELIVTVVIPYEDVTAMSEAAWIDLAGYDMYDGPENKVIWTKTIMNKITLESGKVISTTLNIAVKRMPKLIT